MAALGRRFRASVRRAGVGAPEGHLRGQNGSDTEPASRAALQASLCGMGLPGFFEATGPCALAATLIPPDD